MFSSNELVFMKDLLTKEMKSYNLSFLKHSPEFVNIRITNNKKTEMCQSIIRQIESYQRKLRTNPTRIRFKDVFDCSEITANTFEDVRYQARSLDYNYLCWEGAIYGVNAVDSSHFICQIEDLFA